MVKFQYDNFVKSEQSLAVIPIYPVGRWNVISNKDEEEIDTMRPVKLELKTNPSSPDSVKYACSFQVFSTGTPEQFCRWQDDSQKVYKGLGLTTGPSQVGMVKHLLAEKSEDVFTTYFEE